MYSFTSVKERPQKYVDFESVQLLGGVVARSWRTWRKPPEHRLITFSSISNGNSQWTICVRVSAWILTLIIIRWCCQRYWASKPLLLNLGKLGNGECTQQYQLEVNNRFNQLARNYSEPHTPDELWQQLKQFTIFAATETLQKNCIRLKNCISKHTFEVITKKRETKVMSLDEYKRLRDKLQKMLWRDKQDELETLCGELDETQRKAMPFKPRIVAIKDNAG